MYMLSSSSLSFITLKIYFEHLKIDPYLSFAEIKMHAVVGDGNEFKVKVLHAVDLKLEGQGRLQVAVDAVLDELWTKRKSLIHNYHYTNALFFFFF